MRLTCERTSIVETNVPGLDVGSCHGDSDESNRDDLDHFDESEEEEEVRRWGTEKTTRPNLTS